MNICFKDKNVIVTGAGRGIGKAIALGFIRCKATKVYALERSKEDLDKLVAEVPAGLGTVVPVQVDLCDWDATKEALEKIESIDVVVNNAGVFVEEQVGDVKPESFDFQFSINVKAVINVSQVAAKKMIEQKKQGVIVSLSSQASEMALKGHTVYCATKAAIDAITRVMALELGKHGIRAVAVGPTVVNTDMGRATWSDPVKAKPMLDRIPLNKFAEVEDVVNVILFLASDKAAMVNGTMLPIDGGTLAA